MRQVKLGDGLVQHETLNEDSDKVVIDQVAWQGQIGQSAGGAQAVLEGRSIGHLHSEQWSFILHADVLGTVRER